MRSQCAAKRRSDARLRKATKVLYPWATESGYNQFLQRRVKLSRDLLMDQLKPLFEQYSKDINERAKRTDQTDLDKFLGAVKAVEKGFNRRQIPNQAAINGYGNSVDRFATKQQDKQIALFLPPEKIARVGVSLSAPATAIRQKWTKANVDLIRSIDKRYFDDITKIVREGLESGRSTKSIRAALQQRYQVSRSRAQLIARDQIAKLNGQITEHRQRKAGITEYVWSTVGDEHVRPTHKAHDGKTYKWSDPPANTGHPGEDFQCRCSALPVLPGD